ncbi:MAG: copper-binding protein [Betaproteobacteria bacterium]|nr:copper-binding protein [Betaproteobacteria bacterium]
MKWITTLMLSITLALCAGNTFASDKMGDMKGMDMKGTDQPAANPVKAHQAVGVVLALDAKVGSVTFDHEAVASLNWPRMRMAFAIRDKTLFSKLAVGKKVDFEFVKDGKFYVVTKVK